MDKYAVYEARKRAWLIQHPGASYKEFEDYCKALAKNLKI